MASTSGFRELESKLRQMQRDAAGKVIRESVVDALKPAMDDAKLAIPVGMPPFEGSGKDPYPVRTYLGNLRTPGFARRNIARKSFVHRDGSGVTALLGVRPEAFYAITFVELGTSKQPARPWLVPSFRRNEDKMVERFGKSISARIDRVATGGRLRRR